MKTFTITTGVNGIGRGLILVFVSSLTMLPIGARAQNKNQIVRVAKLQIDSTQIEKYKVELKEEIETSIRIEPGVLTLYAVEEKNRRGQVIIFEVYANEAAYKSHLETPHFKKYKNATKEMVKSLELIETSPIVLGAKTGK